MTKKQWLMKKREYVREMKSELKNKEVRKMKLKISMIIEVDEKDFDDAAQVEAYLSSNIEAVKVLEINAEEI